MASSAPPVSSSPNYNSNGIMTGGGLSYNGTPMNVQNPYMLSPGDLNPAASGYLDNVKNLYSQFSNSAAGGAFNPSFYDNMKQTQEGQITSSLDNQYAKMGLSGSSAEMGGLNQAIQSNQMNWLNRQQGDQMKAMQGLEGLNQQGYGMTTGMQNEYGDFESAFNQSIANLLGVQQQQQASNNASLGGIIGSGLGAAGTALGGYLAPAAVIA